MAVYTGCQPEAVYTQHARGQVILLLSWVRLSQPNCRPLRMPCEGTSYVVARQAGGLEGECTPRSLPFHLCERLRRSQRWKGKNLGEAGCPHPKGTRRLPEPS